MKRVQVSAHLPELKGQCDFTVQGEGSSLRTAIADALVALFKQPKLKHKRITVLRLSVVTMATEKSIDDNQNSVYNQDARSQSSVQL
jgi:hypothetical protein